MVQTLLRQVALRRSQQQQVLEEEEEEEEEEKEEEVEFEFSHHTSVSICETQVCARNKYQSGLHWFGGQTDNDSQTWMQPYVVHKAAANQRATIFTLAIPGWKLSKNLIPSEKSILSRYLLIFERLY